MTAPGTLSKVDLLVVEKLLQQCKSLKDAEQRLMSIIPLPSKALKWGLWDGWTAREWSTDGLYAQKDATQPASDKQMKDYDEGYAVGKRLRLAHREKS